MKKLSILILTAVIISCTSNKQQQEKPDVKDIPSVKLEKVWSSDTVLRTPESIIFDEKRNIFYVSNINNNPWENDGNGFLSKMNSDGEVVELEWVTGLNAPKGMGIFENSLFVTDNDEILEIDIESGTITNRYTTSLEAPQLNDITVGPGGEVYFTGSGASKVFKLVEGEVSIVAEGDFGRPNGLLFDNGRLLMLSFEQNSLSEIDQKTGSLKELAKGLGKADGIEQVGDGGYIVSSWEGEVFYVTKEYDVIKLLDTRDSQIGAADIEFLQEDKLLFVPTFYDNRIMAYRFIKN